jgi:hypothetical protein
MSQLVELVRIALAELGYDPQEVQPPTAERLAQYPGVAFTIKRSAHADAWKAGALAKLSLMGADAPTRCVNTSGQRWYGTDCPLHPVGALLAGTDPGCQP